MIIMEKDQCLKEAAAKQQLELQKSQIQEVFDPV